MQKVTTTKSATTVTAKQKISLFEKLSFVWTLLTVLYSTGFVIFAICSKWGNSKYTFILLGIICAYIVVAITIISVRVSRDKKRQQIALLKIENASDQKSCDALNKQSEKLLKRTKKMLKDYKSGIKILKALINVLFVIMTIAVMFSAVSMRGANNIIAWLSVVVSLLLAFLSLTFKVVTLILKKTLPRIARKGTYAVYDVVDGKVREKVRTNKLLTKVTAKLAKRDTDE